MKKIVTIFLASALMLVGANALAQTATTTVTATATTTQTTSSTTQITPQDLGVSNPTLLPDSPFYFLKNWARSIQSAFTFNPIAKAQLQEKFSSEKLAELQKMVDLNKSSGAIDKAVTNYQDQIQAAQTAADNIKQTTQDSTQVGDFLDKFVQQQTLQQRLLQNLQTQVSTSTLSKIQAATQAHLQKFGDVMTKLEDNNPEQIANRLEKNMQNATGTSLDSFQNLQVLNQLQSTVTSTAKQGVQQAINSSLIRLRAAIGTSTDNNAENNGSEDGQRQLQILNQLQQSINNASATNALNAIKARIMQIIQNGNIRETERENNANATGTQQREMERENNASATGTQEMETERENNANATGTQQREMETEREQENNGQALPTTTQSIENIRNLIDQSIRKILPNQNNDNVQSEGEQNTPQRSGVMMPVPENQRSTDD